MCIRDRYRSGSASGSPKSNILENPLPRDATQFRCLHVVRFVDNPIGNPHHSHDRQSPLRRRSLAVPWNRSSRYYWENTSLTVLLLLYCALVHPQWSLSLFPDTVNRFPWHLRKSKTILYAYYTTEPLSIETQQIDVWVNDILIKQ